MNNFKFLIFSLVLLSISACSKSSGSLDPELDKNSTYGENLRAQIIKLKSQEDRKVAYSQLNDNDRYEIWKSKISNIISQTLTRDDQKKILTELYEHITPGIFKEGDEREIFHNAIFPKWLKKATLLIPLKELETMVFKLEEPNKYNTLSTTGEEQQEACICALYSAYTCYRGSVAWPPSIEFGHCSNDRPVICVQIRDCGALQDLMCNGNLCTW